MSSENAPLLPPSSHRLPTVSASQALQGLHANRARVVSTGIAQLDKILAPPSLPGHDAPGGYMRGKVTEVFGPSGVGKTAFGIQAAVSALRYDQSVVWIDAACAPLVKRRFDKILGATTYSLDYVAAPTLAHLLALFMHPPNSFPRQNTSLIVIDSVSTLVDNSYPRNADDRTAKNKTDQSRWAAGRRFTVINDLMTTFTRFAALHDIALLLTCQTITRIRGPSRALLAPAISGSEWENGVSTRLVLFRDWIRQETKSDTADASKLQKARFVGLVKANGISLANEGGVGTVVPFAIEESGLSGIHIDTDEITAPALDSVKEKPLKRPFSEVEDNADEDPSSDELYGWIEADQVAAEGLLVDPAVDNDNDDDNEAIASPSVKRMQIREKKVTRLSTA